MLKPDCALYKEGQLSNKKIVPGPICEAKEEKQDVQLKL